MCNNTVNNYSHALEFVTECYETQKICDKEVDTHPTAIKYVPERYKTQEMCLKQFIDVFVFDFFLIDIKLKKYVT